MGAVVKHDYAEDIRNHRFGMIAKLVRKGNISSLDQTALNLLADYLVGNLKRPKGRPQEDDLGRGACLHAEYMNLKQYGMTTAELSKFLQENATNDNLKTLMKSLKAKRMKRFDAIFLLADMYGVSDKTVARLINAWSVYQKRSTHLLTVNGLK